MAKKTKAAAKSSEQKAITGYGPGPVNAWWWARMEFSHACLIPAPGDDGPIDSETWRAPPTANDAPLSSMTREKVGIRWYAGTQLREAAYVVAVACERCGIDATDALRLHRALEIRRTWVSPHIDGLMQSVSLLVQRLCMRTEKPGKTNPHAMRDTAIKVLLALPASNEAPMQNQAAVLQRLRRTGYNLAASSVSRAINGGDGEQGLRALGLADPHELRRTAHGDELAAQLGRRQ